MNIPLQPRQPGAFIPLTAAQSRHWSRLERNGSLRSTRICVTAMCCVGELDIGLLSACLDALLCRHESLRTRFVVKDGEPQQCVDDSCTNRLVVIDVQTSSTGGPEDSIRDAVRKFTDEAVDLCTGPLFAARLFRIGPHDHLLVCTLDHMICDGTSLAILEREIWALYRLGLQRAPLILPPLPLQFGDYAIWQSKTYDIWCEQHQQYWIDHLTDARFSRLPGAIGMREVEGEVGTVVRHSFGVSLSERLGQLAQRERCLLPFVVCAVYAAVMLRWCGTDESILVVVSNTRRSQVLAPMVGWLATFLNLRVRINPGETFRSLLVSINREFYNAIKHEDLDRVPDFLPQCGFGGTDLYFNWVPAFAGDGLPLAADSSNSMHELRVLPYPYRAAIPWGFIPVFACINGEVSVIVNHVHSVFPTHVVERFVHNLRAFATELVMDAGSTIGCFQ